MTTIDNPTLTGSPEGDQKLALERIVQLENERRAILEPPGDPLPFGTEQQLLNSAAEALKTYLTAGYLPDMERSAVKHLVEQQLDRSKRRQIERAVAVRLAAGATAAQILQDITRNGA